jgi:uncharacterized DUF497 family protein
MRLVWDEPKRQQNIAEHGLDFADLTSAFFENARLEDAKSGRFLAVGEFESDHRCSVPPVGSEALSIISMRRASKAERNRS